MIHAQARTTTNKRALQKYILAVLGGVLLGGTYAVATPSLQTQTRTALPRPALTSTSHMDQSLRGRDDCAPEVVGIAVTWPMSAPGSGTDRSPVHIGEPVCTWAI